MSDRNRTTEEIDLAATSEEIGIAAPGGSTETRGKVAREAGMMGRIVDRVGYVFAAGIVVAAAILLFEVFMRYFFNSPTIWVHETSVFLCGSAFTFGGLYCTSRNSHIRVVLLYDIFPPRIRRIADIGISLVSAVAAGFFAFAAWSMVKRAVFTPKGDIHFETTGSAWNPPTPGLIKVFVLIVMILLVVQFLILAYNYARGHKDE